jgi:hypothetical protein
VSSGSVVTPNVAQEPSTPALKDATTSQYHGPSSALHNAITLPHAKDSDLLARPIEEHNTASKELFAEASRQRKCRFFLEEQNEVAY